MNDFIFEDNFYKDKLISCDWQYLISHFDISKFRIGEKVFLKSNLEVPLIISNIIENKIFCVWSSDKESYEHDFLPHMLLHYKYAGLLIYKRKYNIYLN